MNSPVSTSEPALSRDEIQRRVNELGTWFHNLDLCGVKTAPNHFLGDYPSVKWNRFAHAIPADLRGKSVLDIGCNAGFYTFELARRGAEVVGIDHDERYLEQARWAAAIFELEDHVDFRRLGVYSLAHGDERYDLVLFLGVLYHLRYPLLALDLLAEKVDRLLVLQTLTLPDEEELEETWGDVPFDRRDVLLRPGWPKAAFVERNLANDPTNWWVPNHACVEAMLRSSGMRVVGRPGHEIYLCEPNPAEPGWLSTHGLPELLSATGRRWKTAER